MKYYKYILLERIGEYENSHDSIVALPDHENIENKAIEIAKENRGSSDDDFDEMGGGCYWFGDGVTFIPDLIEISKETFNIIQQGTQRFKT